MFFALVIAAVVAMATADFVRMEPSVNVFSSRNWLKEKRNVDSEVVSAVFVLKHDKSAVQQFEKELYDLASPSSKNYGKWLTRDQVVERIAPSSSDLKIVTDFLATHGITGENVRVSKLGDKVHVKMSASTAASMMQTEFAQFRHVMQRNIAITRVTKPYYLPEEVAEVVSIVDDIMRFPALRGSPRAYGSEESLLPTDGDEFDSCGKSCSGFTTPDVLQAAYGYPDVKTVASGNSMSVAEFQGQYWDSADLEAFSDACDVTVTVEDTIGRNNPDVCDIGCVEALLDIEYIGAIANPIPLTVINSLSYSLLDWVDNLMEMDDPPLMNSVSYGNDEVQQTSTEYMESCNTQFMAAGAMGLSLLFASGDQGVWGRSGVGSTFHPDFPAASPYITAVGGTDFAEKSTIGEESAWSCGGGGFSDTFEQPSWQASAVSAYLSKATLDGSLPDAAKFNSSGRAYPDVSALGGQVNPYCVAIRGGDSFGGVAGTSASCPVVAGIFAQLNNLRLAAGKPAMGWLNPFIYENGDCFNDISDGSMNNCNAGTQGFSALAGWDPATGFGSPNYECLSKVAML